MPRNRATFAAAALLLASASLAARADTILLKSGDSFTGTITAIHPDSIDVTTPFAGPIHVKRDTVKTLRSDARVTITDAAGASHAAYLSPLADNAGWTESAVVAPPIAAVVPAGPAPVAAAVPGKVYDLNLEPYYLPVGPHWKNQFSLGIVNTTGNTDSTNFASEFNFNYKEKPQELTLKIGGVYDTTNGAQTAGQFFFDAVYRRTLPEWDKSERWYLFGENHELYDAIKAISLRSTSGVGLGYYLFKSDKFTLDLRAGPAFVYERFFNEDTNTDISGLAGLRAVYNINERAALTQDVLYTTAFSDTKRYQLTSETALSLKLPEIARGVGMKFGFRDDYDNSATAPRKNNDTRLTIAMTFDF
jgi:putative salt-induced outer membrane protein YdiY